MQAYIDKGQVSQVNEPIILYHQRENESYFPTVPVTNENEIRFVFEPSAKSNSRSLNNCLYKGLDGTNRLVGVLNRFRKHEFGFVAGVDKTLHSLWVPIEQRDA